MSIHDIAAAALRQHQEAEAKAKAAAEQAEQDKRDTAAKELAEIIGPVLNDLGEGVTIRYVWDLSRPVAVIIVPPHPDYPDITLDAIRVKDASDYSSPHTYSVKVQSRTTDSYGSFALKDLRDGVLVAIAQSSTYRIQATLLQREQDAERATQQEKERQEHEALVADDAKCQREIDAIVAAAQRQLAPFPETLTLYEVQWWSGSEASSTQRAWSFNNVPDADGFWSFVSEIYTGATRRRIELGTQGELTVTEHRYRTIDDVPGNLRERVDLRIPGYVVDGYDAALNRHTTRHARTDEPNAAISQVIGLLPVIEILERYATPAQLAFYQEIKNAQKVPETSEEFPF